MDHYSLAMFEIKHKQYNVYNRQVCPEYQTLDFHRGLSHYVVKCAGKEYH